RGPALDRGNTVIGSYRLAVMPPQSVTQGEGISEPVGRNCGVVDHLRPDLAVRVGGEQGVVDHVAMVADNVRAAPDRIEDLEIRVHDDAQHRLGPNGSGTRKDRRYNEQQTRQLSSVHGALRRSWKTRRNSMRTESCRAARSGQPRFRPTICR